MELPERIAGLIQQARNELGELVAMRSVADARQFPPEECAAAQWVPWKVFRARLLRHAPGRNCRREPSRRRLEAVLRHRRAHRLAVRPL